MTHCEKLNYYAWFCLKYFSYLRWCLCNVMSTFIVLNIHHVIDSKVSEPQRLKENIRIRRHSRQTMETLSRWLCANQSRVTLYCLIVLEAVRPDGSLGGTQDGSFMATSLRWGNGQCDKKAMNG